MKYILISFFIIFFISLKFASASSCCGGGSSSSQVMLGDTSAVFRISYSDATVLADSNADSQMLLRPESQLEAIRTLNLSYSYRLSDLWQWGVAMPIVSKTRMLDSRWQSRQGLGDISLVTGYKVIPEYRRNFLFTRAFIYSSLKFANAPSLFTTQSNTVADLLDTRGSGHELLSLGLMGMKRNTWGMITMQGQLAFRPSKTFPTSMGIQKGTQASQITTESSWDSLLSVTQSFSFFGLSGLSSLSGLSLDFGLTRSYASNQTTSVFIGKPQASLVHTTSIGLNYAYGDYFDVTLSYNDDFLVGPAMNHILSRSVAIGIISKSNL